MVIRSFERSALELLSLFQQPSDLSDGQYRFDFLLKMYVEADRLSDGQAGRPTYLMSKIIDILIEL